MSRKRWPPDDAREWLARARSNLVRAGSVLPEVDLEDLCFDAHQAAEKAVKAVFVHRGESFPYIHDLVRLLDRLKQNGQRVPRYLDDAKHLNPFAVLTRYPGAVAVDQRAYRRAVRIATAVVRWAERQVG